MFWRFSVRSAHWMRTQRVLFPLSGFFVDSCGADGVTAPRRQHWVLSVQCKPAPIILQWQLVRWRSVLKRVWTEMEGWQAFASFACAEIAAIHVRTGFDLIYTAQTDPPLCIATQAVWPIPSIGHIRICTSVTDANTGCTVPGLIGVRAEFPEAC